VVIAVKAGVVSRKEACARYNLSLEELLAWECAFEEHGWPGLRATAPQRFPGPKDT
jgi:hypothetical protein